MKECGTFTIKFNTKEEAMIAAETIQEWARKELSVNGWIDQLFPVESNILFVGNNAAMDWFEYDNKTSRLADVIHNAHPGFVFEGTQQFCRLTTGFEVSEKFSCDGNLVSYAPNVTCSYCGAEVIESEYQFEDMIFCDEDCIKSYLIDALVVEDDFDEEELAEKEWTELAEIYREYL